MEGEAFEQQSIHQWIDDDVLSIILAVHYLVVAVHGINAWFGPRRKELRFCGSAAKCIAYIMEGPSGYVHIHIQLASCLEDA